MPQVRSYALAVALACISIAVATPVAAVVTTLTITSRESPTYSGQSFGSVGQYEKLVGTVSGEIDRSDRRNAIIQDIGLAPLGSQLTAGSRNTVGVQDISFHIDVGAVTEPGRRGRRHLGRNVSEQSVHGLVRPVHLESGAAKRGTELSIVEVGAMATGAIAVVDGFAASRLLRGKAHRCVASKKTWLLR